MIKIATAICMALIFCGIKAASAQSLEQQLHQLTEGWTTETGIYVTGAVREVYFKGISDQIASTVTEDAPTVTEDASTSAEDASTVTENASTVSRLPMEAVEGMAGGPAPDSKRQSLPIGQLATIKTVGLWLQRFPTIRVIVQPMPPKEFLLTINGEPCPATEKAMYLVPAGAVTIRAWRQGSTPCETTYNTVEGTVYVVECAF